MISFKKEFAEVVDVEHCSIYAWGGKPITSANDITKDAGITRNSYLCYIKFNSLVNPVNKVFFLAYRVKAHSSKVRNVAQNQSKWFLTFKDNETGRMELLDRNMAMVVFDFDVDKFFDTQFFNDPGNPERKTCVKLMMDNISKGIENATEFLNANPIVRNECSMAMNGIKLGLEHLGQAPVFNDMGTIKEVDPRTRYVDKEFDIDKMAQAIGSKDKFAGQERGPSASEIRKREREQARQDAAVRKAAAKSNRTLNRLISTIGNMK